MAELLRAMLIVCHLGMAAIAFLYLRGRRMPFMGKLFWAIFALFIPYIGPFTALLWQFYRVKKEE